MATLLHHELSAAELALLLTSDEAALLATADHDHDSDYSAIDHDHDGTYTPVEHNHDLEYLALGAAPVLTDTVWDDLRFPASGINPPGGASDATRNTTSGTLDFAGNADNVIMGQAQMPHAWKEGSAVEPHVHLRFPTSAASNTRWKFEYDVANVGGDFANDVGTWTDGGTITVANPQNVRRHVIAGFADIDMTGKTLSAIIVWKLSRLASSDAADNHTSAVQLLEFDIHHEIDSLGSSEEYTK